MLVAKSYSASPAAAYSLNESSCSCDSRSATYSRMRRDDGTGSSDDKGEERPPGGGGIDDDDDHDDVASRHFASFDWRRSTWMQS